MATLNEVEARLPAITAGNQALASSIRESIEILREQNQRTQSSLPTMSQQQLQMAHRNIEPYIVPVFEQWD